MKDRYFSVSKKGNMLFDSMYILIALVVISLVLLFSYMMLSDLNDTLQVDDMISTDAKTILQTQTDNTAPLFDNMFIFILGGLWLSVLFSAFLIDTHPAFFIVSFILLVALIIVSATLSNGLIDVFSDPDVVSYSTQFTKTNFVIQNLPLVCLVIAATIGIVLFAKGRVN